MKFYRCQRCDDESKITTLSWFNLDIICEECSEIEEKHPLFKVAKEEENKALKKGDLNYPGIFHHLEWEEIKDIKEYN